MNAQKEVVNPLAGKVFFTHKRDPVYVKPLIQITGLLRNYGHVVKKWITYPSRSKTYYLRTTNCNHCSDGFIFQIPMTDGSHILYLGRSVSNYKMLFSFANQIVYNVGIDYARKYKMHEPICSRLRNFL